MEVAVLPSSGSLGPESHRPGFKVEVKMVRWFKHLVFIIIIYKLK